MRKARTRTGKDAGSRKAAGRPSESRRRSKTTQATTAKSVGPTDEELFPIFAKCGMKPGDLVDAMAKRYASYLEQHKMSRRKARGPDVTVPKR